MLARARELLVRSPSFRLILLATLGSGIGTWLAVIALAVDIFDRTGSGVWVGALLMADFLPAVVVGLLLGPLVDRLSRRRLMIGSDLVRAAVFVALPFTGSATSIVALAAVAGFATGFFRPAALAALPNLVPDEALEDANSIYQTVENLTTALAPIAAGGLVAAFGTDVAYGTNAVSFLLSAVLIARIAPSAFQAERPITRGHWRDLREGFEVVLRTRALLAVLIAWTMIGVLANAGVNVAEVFLAQEAFGAGDLGFGLLVAGSGAGAGMGSILASPALAGRPVSVVYGVSIALMGVGALTAAVSPTIWLGIVGAFVLGLGNGSAVVCNILLVQRSTVDAVRGRVFTLLHSSTWVFLGLGMLVAGTLTDILGPRWVWGIASIFSFLAAAVGYRLVRGSTTDTESSPAPSDVAPMPLTGPGR